jgi:hypothetical protein
MTNAKLDKAVSESLLIKHLDKFCYDGCEIGEEYCAEHFCTALDLIYKLVGEGFDIQKVEK